MMLRVRYWLCSVGLLAALGCGSSPDLPKWPDPVPAGGTVTYGDAPLADAIVTFSPMGSTEGRGSSAVTNAEGKYELETPWTNGKLKKGAIPGTYAVAFSRMVKSDGSVWKPDKNTNAGPATEGAAESVPPEYSVNSKLIAEVKSGGGPIDFKLEKKK